MKRLEFDEADLKAMRDALNVSRDQLNKDIRFSSAKFPTLTDGFMRRKNELDRLYKKYFL